MRSLRFLYADTCTDDSCFASIYTCASAQIRSCENVDGTVGQAALHLVETQHAHHRQLHRYGSWESCFVAVHLAALQSGFELSPKCLLQNKARHEEQRLLVAFARWKHSQFVQGLAETIPLKHIVTHLLTWFLNSAIKPHQLQHLKLQSRRGGLRTLACARVGRRLSSV